MTLEELVAGFEKLSGEVKTLADSHAALSDRIAAGGAVAGDLGQLGEHLAELAAECAAHGTSIGGVIAAVASKLGVADLSPPKTEPAAPAAA